MAKQKGSLLGEFKRIILDNHKNGRKLRQGIPSVFTAADGREYRINNVGRFIRTGENPTFLDVAKNKEVSAARAAAIKLQTSTSKKVTPWNPATDVTKGLEGHHMRAVKQYAPFYKGLNDKEARELTQWFVDEGVPLGNVKENIDDLSPKVHKQIHTWAKENNVQVFQDKTGKGNFSIGKDGDLRVKGSPNTAVKAVMPDMSSVPLNARYAAIANYLEYVQGPMDTKLSELKWDEQNQKSRIPESEVQEWMSEIDTDKKIDRVRSNIPNKMKIGGKLRTADSLAQIASGNYIGGGLGLALQQDPVQKQIAKLLAKRASKTTAKLVPGVDIGLSAMEAAQYFSSGNYIQGGMAMLSGAVGWIPGVGDAASAAIDLTNTGIDIKKLKTQGIMNRHKKIDTDNLDLNLRGFRSF